MPLVCPICNSVAQELDRSSDANGFYCPTHCAFKVADTVFAEHWAKDYTRPQWEAALRKAKAENEAGEWPLINSKDFCTLHFNLFPWVPFTERTTGSANRMMLVGMAGSRPIRVAALGLVAAPREGARLRTIPVG